MTPRKFFVGRAIGLIVLLVIAGIYFLFTTYISPSPSTTEDISSQEDQVTSKPPVFTWRFEEADTLNPDGNPNTNVYLTATYPAGEVESKLVDTTAGSCNEVPDMAEDIALNSTVIQCYSAGLGYYFKITEGEDSYQIERKTFEEALPDYEPPEYFYEIIAEFPLTV